MGGEEHGDIMGGSEFGDDWELAASPTTLVLVGHTGNGKSATGNSILGRSAFTSKCRASAVTSTCELQSTTRADGRCIRVVDTPGLFDPTMKADFVTNEIIKCLDLTNDGVHALLLVLSVRNRFTAEEEAAVESLQIIFGEKVVNYMIVLFTCGDDLDEDETLEDYLSTSETPKYLRTFIDKCRNRTVLFENKTKDADKKEQQFSELMNMIDDMVAMNGGMPYTSDLLKEARELADRRRDQANELRKPADFETMREQMEERFDRFKFTVEERLRLNAERMEEKLLAEKRAREEVELRARLDKEKSEADIRELREALELAGKEREKERKEREKERQDFAEEMRKQSGNCKIF